jgi:hypothetical protein
LPSQPSLNRGTLILLAPNATSASISSKNVYFVFQYNPEKLLHTFNQAVSSGLGANTSESQGYPVELFYLTFELDSADVDVSFGNKSSANLGLHSALAMLELMMQPQVVGKQTSMPIVVFKWGGKRSVAVRLISMSVEEASFDITLNPSRASVSLTLRVLDASEISNNSAGKSICVNHQIMQATLVDAYKVQTGQSTGQSGSVLGVSGVVGAGSSVESKTKISA